MDAAAKKRYFIVGVVTTVTLVGAVLYFSSRGAKKDDSDNNDVTPTSKKAKKVHYQHVTVSAPGKALVAGGYLVLTRPNLGVVISATARFYTTVAWIPYEVATRSSDTTSIFVDSPQFHTTFEFSYTSTTNQLTSISSTENKFVEKCLSVVLSFALQHFGQDEFSKMLNISDKKQRIGIRMQADNDFYSQIKALKALDIPLVSSSLKTIPQFNPCPKLEDGSVEVAKTGMGSSAALTVSLVGALLQWFGIVSIETEKSDKDSALIHNLAQLAHGTIYVSV
jgi:phosphomevalonate kinase